MPSLIKRFVKHLYEVYFSEEEDFNNQFQNNSQKKTKTVKFVSARITLISEIFSFIHRRLN